MLTLLVVAVLRGVWVPPVKASEQHLSPEHVSGGLEAVAFHLYS